MSAKSLILATLLFFVVFAIGIVAFLATEGGWQEDSSPAVWFMLFGGVLYVAMFFVYRSNWEMNRTVARYFSSTGKGATEGEALEALHRYSPLMLVGGAVFLVAGIVGLLTG